MSRISNAALDAFALKVMAVSTNKSWGTDQFKRLVICAGNGMTVEETAKEIDAMTIDKDQDNGL